MTRTTTPTTPTRDPLAGDPAEAAIRGMVATIVRETQPRPLSVILFGSRARGDHCPTSDADLLVVLPEIPAGVTRRQLRAALYDRLSGAGLPKDILVATLAQLAEARGDYSSTLHHAQEQGVTLYRADDAALGAAPAAPGAGDQGRAGLCERPLQPDA